MTICEKISQDLKLDILYISRIAKNSSRYYKDYSVPKHDGGYRSIAQPSAELKSLQYWIVANILGKLPVSPAASAYKAGASIKKHANTHKDHDHLFHTDIKDFFPSIHLEHLSPILQANKTIFDELGLDLESAIHEIGQICFRQNALCIGAVSSPMISNVIMFDFDKIISEYCAKKNYTYTRYADDIYISSTEFIEKDIVSYIGNVLSDYRFKINHRKTGFYSSKYRRRITGLIITNEGSVSVGTSRRNEIRKLVYNKLVNKQGDPAQILGYLSYLKDIEPNTYNDLIIKYSKYCSGDIVESLNQPDISKDVKGV